MVKRKKNKKLFKFDKYLLILGVVSALFMASVVRYSLKTYLIPQWDEQYYMYMASSYWRFLQHPTLGMIHEIITFQGVKQMGYPFLILPFLLTFGLKDSYFWGLFTNGLLYVVTIFGIYFVSKNFLSRFSSFMAAIIFSCYSWTLFHVHFAYNETASSATIVWTIYFLIKSNLFRSRIHSILFGLFFGFALLTRWIAPVFVTGPLIYVLYEIINKKLFKKKYVLANLIFAFVITLVVSFYPYYVNFYFIYNYFYGVRVGGEMWQSLPKSQKSQLSLYSATFYFNIFNLLGTYFFALIISGFVLALKKPRRLMTILLAVIVPWIFFSFLSILKEDRYIIPIYPYLAILSASVFDKIRNLKLKAILIILTLVLSLGTFLATDWGKGPMSGDLKTIQLPFTLGELKNIYLTSVSRPPYIYKISGKEIVEYLAQEDQKGQIKNSQIIALFYYKSLNEPMMTYNLYHQEKPLNIVNFLGTTVKKPQETSYIMKTIFDSNHLLSKTGNKVDKSFSKQDMRLLRALVKLFEKDFDIKKYYEEKRRFWVYQDSSELIVYKRKNEISPEEIERLRLKLVEYLK